jgi:hypothetical protein
MRDWLIDTKRGEDRWWSREIPGKKKKLDLARIAQPHGVR